MNARTLADVRALESRIAYLESAANLQLINIEAAVTTFKLYQILLDVADIPLAESPEASAAYARVLAAYAKHDEVIERLTSAREKLEFMRHNEATRAAPQSGRWPFGNITSELIH